MIPSPIRRKPLIRAESFKKADTGNEDVDGIQHSVGEAVGDTVGANGIGADAGNAVDKGILRGNV